jgi:large subunit ribosomal protein L15
VAGASSSAKEAIEKAGGTLEVLAPAKTEEGGA